jgi:ABC-type glutathione transport system ATPase component
MDRIIVMEQGRIVESGSHTQLLAKQGLYATMWHTQQQERQRELLGAVAAGDLHEGAATVAASSCL